jgi:hypothetical protein
MFSNPGWAFLRLPLALLIVSSVLWCSEPTLAQYELQSVPSPSNYGGAGLLDTRSARFYPDGYLVLSASFSEPDDRYAATVQALPWAELTFRYAVTRGIPAVDITQHPRSLDIKIRLSNEDEYLPELAIGLQDFFASGVYAGEYLVGSKRWNRFDFSLGLGWGRLGSRGTFENPFRIFGSYFDTRPGNGNGTVPVVGSYFRGPNVGMFAGVAYKTPIENLELKVEYSSDAYVAETSLTGLDYGFPLNVGFSYRAWSWLDVGLSWMHGREIGLRIATFVDSASEIWPVRLDPPPRFRARPEEAASTILNRESAASAAAAVETHYVDLATQSARDWAVVQGPAPNEEPDGVMGAGPSSLEPAKVPGSPSADALAPIRAATDIQGAAEQPHFVDLTQPESAAIVPAMGPPPDVASVSADVSATSPTGSAPRMQSPPPKAIEEQVLAPIRTAITSQKLIVLALRIEDDKISVLIENNRYRRDVEAIARAARALSATAPANIEYFEITVSRVGLPITTVMLLRTQIDRLARNDSSPTELLQASDFKPASAGTLEHIEPGQFPKFDVSAYPVFRQQLFDPNNPVYVEFGVGATGSIRLTPHWFIEGSVTASLYNDFNQITRVSNSALPHVRSDLVNYLQQGSNRIESLTTSYLFKLAPEVYGRASAG